MATRTERAVNVGESERIVSAIAGGILAAWGLSRTSLPGLLVAGVGAALGYRGISGHCDAYAKLGIDTGGAHRNVGNLGVKITEEIVVNAPPRQVYDIWRNLENLPRLLSHVERVEMLTPTRSRWTVKGPAGMRITWEAELINDKPGELIAWRTVDSTLVDHAGSVTFEPLANHGTRVRVSLQYDPPGGRFGHAVAALLSEDAGSILRRDLAEFKRAVEEGRLAA
ncbi:MAG TPA: SRPBCC family protein [Methylomirabilota bacterium]|nr:SRPBCC family protein [Methylomirabilota bacterium]